MRAQSRRAIVRWRALSSLASVLVLAVSCTNLETEGGSDPPSATTTSSSIDVQQWITDRATAWLDGFSGPAELPCPPGGNALIQPTDERMRACFVGEPGSFAIRAQNLTAVPISVWGNPATNVYTIEPGMWLDVPVVNPQFQQSLYYRADAVAGLTTAIADELNEKVDEYQTGGMTWVTCVADPDQNCVLNALVQALPARVTIRGRSIPLESLAEGLNVAYQNADLLSAFSDELTGSDPGTLTIVPR